MSWNKIIFAAHIILAASTCPLPAQVPEKPAFEPAPASGNPSGWQEISNYRGWKIKSLKLTGLEKFRSQEIKRGLELYEKDAVLYERSLGRDIDRIRLFLALRGHPYSVVSPSISPTDGKKEVAIILTVDPGPPVLVGAVKIDGLPARFSETARNSINLKVGTVFSDAALAEDKSSIIEILAKAGYARASAVSRVKMTDTTDVSVLYNLSPGAVYYFDSFRADGASKDLNELALSTLNVRKGERFDPKTVQDAKDNLSGLQLFGQIQISLKDTAPDSLEMVVELSERKLRTLEVAGGYWSDNGLSARVSWQHSNLFKRGRGVSLEVSYMQYKQSGRAIAWWPAIFSARLLGTLRVGYDNISEDSFDKTSPGIALGLTLPHTRRMKSSLMYVIEWARYDIKTTEKESFHDPEGPISYFEYQLIRDGTDDMINPTRGTYSSLRLEYGPKGDVTNSEYLLAEVDGTVHVPLAKRIVLATNLHLGSATPLAKGGVLLPDKRFYAGGSTMQRGFNRRRLGPLDDNGLPLGGEVMMVGFVELRFPLFWKLDGAAFVDAGQVWRTHRDFTWDDIEIAVGPAIRIMTPVGPLRFDFGYRLTDYEPREPGYAFHFAIGYPM
jgi:outer membrane protein insertion porin family